MADQDEAKNKGGRPFKNPQEGKRPSVTFRCRAGLQAKLQTEAQQADRSVSEEIERRLEQSFEFMDLIRSVSSDIAREATTRTIEKMYERVGGRTALANALVFAHMLQT